MSRREHTIKFTLAAALTLAVTFADIAVTPASAGDTSRAVVDATLSIGGGKIEIQFAPGDVQISHDGIVAWVSRAACAVTSYYGRFPIKLYRVLVVPDAGKRGVITGTTWGSGGAHSRILLGSETQVADLRSDWVMTHEMVHLAFPSVSDQHHWIEEGIATYVEPIARAQIGTYPVAQVWADLVEGLPKGMPQAGDEGLDRTHTWGRTYWGGAMFCLLADLEIRRRTHNRLGLEDALRGILAAGGNIEGDWPVERAFEAADNATGVPVLTGLYSRMKDAPMAPDLPALWKQLGVETHSGKVTFDDDATDSAIRRLISSTSPPGQSLSCAETTPPSATAPKERR